MPGACQENFKLQSTLSGPLETMRIAHFLTLVKLFTIWAGKAIVRANSLQARKASQMLHYNGNTIGNHGEARTGATGATLPQWLIVNCNAPGDWNGDLIVSARDTTDARRIYWAFVTANGWPLNPDTDHLWIFRIPAPVTGEPAAHIWQCIEGQEYHNLER